MNYTCRDCQIKIKTKGKELLNGVLLKYLDGKEEIWVIKCKECFTKNPELTNYQECEVYSRVCGYYRPVENWHASKKEEYKERKPFKVKAE